MRLGTGTSASSCIQFVGTDTASEPGASNIIAGSAFTAANLAPGLASQSPSPPWLSAHAKGKERASDNKQPDTGAEQNPDPANLQQEMELYVELFRMAAELLQHELKDVLGAAQMLFDDAAFKSSARRQAFLRACSVLEIGLATWNKVQSRPPKRVREPSPTDDSTDAFPAAEFPASDEFLKLVRLLAGLGNPGTDVKVDKSLLLPRERAHLASQRLVIQLGDHIRAFSIALLRSMKKWGRAEAMSERMLKVHIINLTERFEEIVKATGAVGTQ
jgi:hypothetical protein